MSVPGPSGSILVVVHALPPEEASGTPLATDGYARALSGAGWDVAVMSMGPDAPPWDVIGLTRRDGEPFLRVPVRAVTGPGSLWGLTAPSHPAPATLPRTGEDPEDPTVAIAKLLEQLQPDVVHVVDFVHLPLSIPEIAHRMGIPVVRTVACAEDLCALIAPVSSCSGPSGYCPAPLTVDRCAACLSTTEPALAAVSATGDADVDRHRRERVLRLLSEKRARAVHQFSGVYDRIVFASERFRRYFEETLPLDPRRVRVVPMGIDVSHLSGPFTSEMAEDSQSAPWGGAASGSPVPLRFLLAAMADPAKGTQRVVECFTHPELAARDDWRLVLAGGGDRAMYGPLLADQRVTDHGPYSPAELGSLFGRGDVGLSPSVFETFHRTTREYLACGLPVVGSMAFGISDVVVHGHNGLLFDHAEPGSLRRAVLSLLDDRELVGRLRVGARATRIRSVAEEVEELMAVYGEVVAVGSPARMPAL